MICKKKQNLVRLKNTSGFFATEFTTHDHNKACLALLIKTVSNKHFVTWRQTVMNFFEHDLLDALQSLSVCVWLESYHSFVDFQTYKY